LKCATSYCSSFSLFQSLAVQIDRILPTIGSGHLFPAPSSQNINDGRSPTMAFYPVSLKAEIRGTKSRYPSRHWIYGSGTESLRSRHAYSINAQRGPRDSGQAMAGKSKPSFLREGMNGFSSPRATKRVAHS
jgi:hypothetical protein